MNRHPQPLNAFSPQYLGILRRTDDPPTAFDADLAGPWCLREELGTFHIFRQWQSSATGHSSIAEFADRAEALLFLAALRSAARLPLYRLRGTVSAEGQEVEREGRVIGRVNWIGDELLQVVNVLAAAAGSPADLAVLFQISGSQIQEMAGEILAQDALEGDGEVAGPLARVGGRPFPQRAESSPGRDDPSRERGDVP